MKIRFYYISRKGDELLAVKDYKDCPIPRSGETVMVEGHGYVAMRCIYDLDIDTTHVLCRRQNNYHVSQTVN